MFRALRSNQILHLKAHEPDQVALSALIGGAEEFAQQEWAYQSVLFFYEGHRIEGVESLDVRGWHNWALDRARAFADAYPKQLVPFSRSGLQLDGVPDWPDDIGSFELCDKAVHDGWGFSADTLRNEVEIREYKALVVHIIYASLTKARETFN